MPVRAAITALTLPRPWRQFPQFTLDLTHPETGAPLDRVCLIGPNGTGKTTLLYLLQSAARIPGIDWQSDVAPTLSWTAPDQQGGVRWISVEAPPGYRVLRAAVLEHGGPMPNTSLDAALKFQPQHRRHLVSAATLDQMWTALVWLVNRRESDRREFELRPENLQRTKAQLLEEFDRTNPPVLDRLAQLWDRILRPAGLYFDVGGARLPVQLRDNLVAHIVHRGSNKPVRYDELSSGTRDYLFRLGHVFLLYAGLPRADTVVLVDEPENSLFPDLRLDLVDTYDEIFSMPDVGPTQAFFATHDPLIAAQFHPWERVVLEWGPDERVRFRRGVAPKGDDPNDLLRKDFGLAHVMGREGRRAWDRYMALRREAREAADPDARIDKAREAAELATQYGFEPPRAEG